MMVIPLIELQAGRCVSLRRGRLEEAEIWHVDPVETARRYAAAGAEWLHVTDFDAIAGDGRNRDLLLEIVRHAGLPVQLGGGVRTLEAVEDWIGLGVGRVVLGTVAVNQPDLVKTAAKYHPDQIVLAVDVYQGRVMTDGWRSPSVFAPEDFLRQFDRDPLAAIIVTDIDADLEEAEDSLALVTRLAGLVRTPVLARGLVRSRDDLSRLKYVPDVAGALVGRALLDRSLDLGEALALARPEPEPKAEFL
jgi:phosphoribosylformimino-5-aminoimidazole carboxamide ribotide isomerase